MSAHEIMVLLAPTAILAIVVAMIAHDKWLAKRRSKQCQKTTYDPKLLSPKHQALTTLTQLEESADIDQILTALQREWTIGIPKSVLEKAVEVFGSENGALCWLTSRQPELEYCIPAEISRISAGEQMVLQTLKSYGE